MKRATRAGLSTIGVLALAACGSEPVAPTTDGPLLVAFDSLWTRYDRIYPSFGYKQLDWLAQRTRYRPLAESARNADELAAITRQMLAPLRDVHAWTVTPARATMPSYVPERFVNWRRSVWDGQLQAMDVRRQSGGWGYAWFGKVPYVYFESWGQAFDPAVFDNVLELFRDSPAMVIDVRMNGGGNDALSLAVAGRFYDQSRTFAYVRFRSGPRHDDLTVAQPRTIGPRGQWQFNKPVLLLVGRGCYSSNESFILALGQLAHVTVAGDTTGGGSGNPVTFALADGWSYSVPRWIEYDSDFRVIEWAGIAPRQLIAATGSDFDAGREPILDYARAWAAAKQ